MNPIKPLGHYAFESIPTIYDEDALTALELCARTAKKTNECVKAFNDHLNECKDEHQRHEQSCDTMHKEHTEQVQQTLDRQDQEIAGAVEYMKDNLEENCGALFDQAVENGVFDTVSRETYQNMTAGVFNVREYGAKGDGETDDTNAIQTAIDNANRVTGSTVYLPAGVYKVSAPITVHSHTRLIGGGKRGLSDTGYSGTHIVGDLDGAIIQADPNVETVYGVEIRDLRVCKYGDRKPAYGIKLDHSSECYLHNVTVNGGCAVGLYFQGSITQLDNLYICGNDIGIKLEGHAITVSNLNAWENTGKAIVLEGTLCNVTVRDSWIENSLYGFFFDNSTEGLLAHVINIQNTSFTAGSAYEEAEFIRAMDTGNNTFCVQALNVTGCVAKIYNGGLGFVEFHSGDYTIKANFKDCIFFANTSGAINGDGNIREAIWSEDQFNNITVENCQAQLYDGSVIPFVSYAGNYLEIKTGSKYTEVNTFYPIKLGMLEGELQTYDAGQLYVNAQGVLKYTDGTTARTVAFSD